MNQKLPISRVINLIPEESQRLWSIDESEARRRLLAGDTEGVLGIDGSFALVAQDGERVMLARSLDRPMRYFLAKSVDGPVLIVAERMDEIAAELGLR
jgi:asparagine synthase (glutamine-hydrolysing)